LFISFDGYTIYDGGGSANAVTTTGDYSLAIAYGDGASAQAAGTGGGLAVADGSGAAAFSAGGTGDVAEAVGTNADAWAGGYSQGVTGADYDTAIDIGNNVNPAVYLTNVGAYAGNSDLAAGTDGGTGVHDTAIDIGNNTNGGTQGLNDGAFAGAGALAGGNGSGDGNNDTAIDVGNNSGLYLGSRAVEGNGNYASDSGNNTGFSPEQAYAGKGNDNTAVGTTDNAEANAYGGNDNYAYVDGPANSTAYAYDGDSNIAYISDPFGAAGSPDSAIAGNGFSNDLAEVLLAHGNTTADTANLLYDIVSLFGNISGSF
jgi:hypothetical protein